MSVQSFRISWAVGCSKVSLPVTTATTYHGDDITGSMSPFHLLYDYSSTLPALDRASPLRKVNPAKICRSSCCSGHVRFVRMCHAVGFPWLQRCRERGGISRGSTSAVLRHCNNHAVDMTLIVLVGMVMLEHEIIDYEHTRLVKELAPPPHVSVVTIAG